MLKNYNEDEVAVLLRKNSEKIERETTTKTIKMLHVFPWLILVVLLALSCLHFRNQSQQYLDIMRLQRGSTNIVSHFGVLAPLYPITNIDGTPWQISTNKSTVTKERVKKLVDEVLELEKVVENVK